MAWIGALPPAAFGAGAIGQQLTASEPFVWGAGGSRRTPEEIAAEQRMAQAMMMEGADFSPVGHWTQGLARATQGILGGLQSRSLRKEAKETAAAQQATDAAVLDVLFPGGVGNDPVAAAMFNPDVSPAVREAAGMQYKLSHPAAPAPTEFERLMETLGIQRGSPEWLKNAQMKLTNTVDPLITIPTANGPYVAPRSEVLMEGGGPASMAPGGSAPLSSPPVPTAPVGKLTPIQGGASPAGSRTFR